MSLRRFLVLVSAMVLLLALTAHAEGPVKSVYSSLSGCKLIKKGPNGEPWSISACQGYGGYGLRLEYDDDRESITVIAPNGKKHPLNFWQVISNGFSSVGQKAEWRVTRKNGKVIPIALIVRFNASEDPADSSKITSYLAVAKITPTEICVTDKIAPSATANEDARKAADAAVGKKCLE